MGFTRKIPLALFLLIQVCLAVEHNLPEGLEIVDPRSLGLAGADLDKFLGNVKLLPVSGNGLGAKEGPKTQILTVGFEGDEGINLDDFELPSVDNLPDSEKTVAQAAFSRFKDFFKDPSKSKTIIHDEDLAEDPLTSDIQKIATTTPPTVKSTTTLTTTTTAPSRSRTVYRPRTTTPTPKTTTRVRKIKRPAGFRRITSTPAPTTTDLPEDFLQGLTGGDSKRIVEFKPEQFQDYAKIIQDLQNMGPRGQASRDADRDEGAPIGLLGFKQVNEPGHKGPPIFEFGSSGPSKPKAKPYSTATYATTSRPPSVTSRVNYQYQTTTPLTTSKPTTGYPPQTRYLSNRPHGNTPISSPSTPVSDNSGSANRYSSNSQFTSNSAPSSEYQNGNAQKQIVSSEEQSNSNEQNDKTAFEQISAQPIGSDHHSSFRVPFRFPEDEDKQTQYEQIYEQHLLTQASPQQQQQPQQQQVALTQIVPLQQQQVIRPTILAQVPSQIQYTQQTALNGFVLQQQTQLQLLQEQYQRQQQEQQRRLQQLTEQLKLQQQQSQQLQQQLKIHTQQRHSSQPQQQQQHQGQQQSQQAYQPVSTQYQQNQQTSPVNYYPAQYQPQGFAPSQSQIHDNQHQIFRQSPIPIANANTIRPDTYQTQNPNYFRPSLADKSTRPAEPHKHLSVVQHPVSPYGPDAKPPQLIPISTIENALRPNVYTHNRFALPQNQNRHQQQQSQSSQYVNHFSQRPHGPPLIHPSHQFAIRSSENAEGRLEDSKPLITPAALIGTFSLAPQISQKVTSAP